MAESEEANPSAAAIDDHTTNDATATASYQTTGEFSTDYCGFCSESGTFAVEVVRKSVGGKLGEEGNEAEDSPTAGDESSANGLDSTSRVELGLSETYISGKTYFTPKIEIVELPEEDQEEGGHAGITSLRVS
eukprot:UC4_evm1s1417